MTTTKMTTVGGILFIADKIQRPHLLYGRCGLFVYDEFL